MSRYNPYVTDQYSGGYVQGSYGGPYDCQPCTPQYAVSDYDRGYSAGETAAAVTGAVAVLGLGYWLYKSFVEK